MVRWQKQQIFNFEIINKTAVYEIKRLTVKHKNNSYFFKG